MYILKCLSFFFQNVFPARFSRPTQFLLNFQSALVILNIEYIISLKASWNLSLSLLNLQRLTV